MIYLKIISAAILFCSFFHITLTHNEINCLTYESQIKKALIFGITGQDGSYLSEFLLNKGYEVHGVIRRASINNTARLAHLLHKCDEFASPRFTLHYGDITDTGNIVAIISKIRPHEIYNLAAQSHVKISFEEPEHTGDVDALGTVRILEAIRTLGLAHQTKFYQASTSEMYGKVQETPQKETTPFYPRSPYAVSKLYSYWITKNYREAYDIFACNGILFNHESPRRGENFVTRKITLAVAHRALGEKSVLYLGNLDASRDWGYAGDYVEAMWLMLQQPTPDDFVIATGQTYKVRDFVYLAFKEIGIIIEWQGSGISEVGIDKNTKETLVRIDPQNFRPAEVDYLVGDASKANKALGWKPRTSLEELAKLMVQADINQLKNKDISAALP